MSTDDIKDFKHRLARQVAVEFNRGLEVPARCTGDGTKSVAGADSITKQTFLLISQTGSLA